MPGGDWVTPETEVAERIAAIRVRAQARVEKGSLKG